MKWFSMLVLVLIQLPLYGSDYKLQLDDLQVRADFKTDKHFAVSNCSVSYTIRNISPEQSFGWLVFRAPAGAVIHRVYDTKGPLQFHQSGMSLTIQCRAAVPAGGLFTPTIEFSIKKVSVNGRMDRLWGSQRLSDDLVFLNALSWLVVPWSVQEDTRIKGLPAKKIKLSYTMLDRRLHFIPHDRRRTVIKKRRNGLQYTSSTEDALNIYTGLSLCLIRPVREHTMRYRGIDFRIMKKGINEAKILKINRFIRKLTELLENKFVFLTKPRECRIVPIVSFKSDLNITYHAFAYGNTILVPLDGEILTKNQKANLIHEILHLYLRNRKLVNNIEEAIIVYLTDLISQDLFHLNAVKRLQSYFRMLVLYKKVYRRLRVSAIALKAKKISALQYQKAYIHFISKYNPQALCRYGIGPMFFHYIGLDYKTAKIIRIINRFVKTKNVTRNFEGLLQSLDNGYTRDWVRWYRYMVSLKVRNLLTLKKRGQHGVVLNNTPFRMAVRVLYFDKMKRFLGKRIVTIKAKGKINLKRIYPDCKRMIIDYTGTSGDLIRKDNAITF